jgi:hypothetical protein
MEWKDPRDMDPDEYEHYLREEKARDHISADNPVLADWLHTQQQAFAAWAHTHRERGPWNFTLDSLPRLEALIRSTFTTFEQADALMDTPQVAVPAWYLGEVHNRVFGTQWQFHPGFADDNPLDHRPHVTLPWDRRDDFYYTDPEHIEDDARPIYSPTSVICNLPRRPPAEGLLEHIDDYWQPGNCDDPYCRYHSNQAY